MTSILKTAIVIALVTIMVISMGCTDYSDRSVRTGIDSIETTIASVDYGRPGPTPFYITSSEPFRYEVNFPYSVHYSEVGAYVGKPVVISYEVYRDGCIEHRVITSITPLCAPPSCQPCSNTGFVCTTHTAPTPTPTPTPTPSKITVSCEIQGYNQIASSCQKQDYTMDGDAVYRCRP